MWAFFESFLTLLYTLPLTNTHKKINATKSHIHVVNTSLISCDNKRKFWLRFIQYKLRSLVQFLVPRFPTRTVQFVSLGDLWHRLVYMYDLVH